MWVKFKFKTKDGNCYRLKSQVTIKEAKEIFEKEYKDDNDVIKVWLTYFDTWHERYYKTLKDIEEKEK